MTIEQIWRWEQFADAAPELATFGAARLDAPEPSFLATVRGDALPRVHPVSAVVRNGRLAVYMYATSPKGRDIMSDGRYALHASVADNTGGSGEFHVRGHAALAEEPHHLAALEAAGFSRNERYVLFELGVDEAFGCVYEGDDATPNITRWRR